MNEFQNKNILNFNELAQKVNQIDRALPKRNEELRSIVKNNRFSFYNNVKINELKDKIGQLQF